MTRIFTVLLWYSHISPFSPSWTKNNFLCSLGLVMCAGTYGYCRNQWATQQLGLLTSFSTKLQSNFGQLGVFHLNILTAKLTKTQRLHRACDWDQWVTNETKNCVSTENNLLDWVLSTAVKRLKFKLNLKHLRSFKVWSPPVAETIFNNPINFWTLFWSTKNLDNEETTQEDWEAD